MSTSLGKAFARNFLGNSPRWFKKSIIAFLIINPIIFSISPFLAGWLLVAEFIFALAMALKCYPLQPGGLIALEAIALGMTSPEAVYEEVLHNFPVILLLMFMVAGIYFMQNLLLFLFTKILLGIRSKAILSFLFCIVSAFLSAFLDALTVTAVLISVAVGFYVVYHKFASGKREHQLHDHSMDSEIHDNHQEDLKLFRSFLRSLIMHGAVGTALGGVCTVVGEPQNLLIAKTAGWDFATFFMTMAPVSMPVLIAGIITTFVLEKTRKFGYGTELPDRVRIVLTDYNQREQEKRSTKQKVELITQGVVACLLIVGLATHVAEVGLIGLGVIVLLTAFNGVIEEHQIGHAFEEALPFTALLIVFFAVVAVIHEQHLFAPVTHWVLSFEESMQGPILFMANGFLSMISDNVFVATVYINEVKTALDSGSISREHFDKLAISINTGTNLPSVATPNGQAAFLFLLTSALAPLIRLSYGRMVWMALPYTVVLTLVGLIMVTYNIS